MENKIVLSQYIENNLEDLGISKLFPIEVIHYFLKKNLITLFGKDVFESYEVELNTVAEHEYDFTTNVPKKRRCHKLQMYYGGVKYTIASKEEGKSLVMSANQNATGFRIAIDKNKIYNSNTTITEIETINNLSCLCLYDKPYFDYQKILYRNSEEIIFPIYRAKPILVQQGEYQLFEILELENLYLEKRKMLENASIYEIWKQTLKEYITNLKTKSEICKIPCSKTDLDSYDNFDAIFKLLEEKTETISKVRKRIKE